MTTHTAVRETKDWWPVGFLTEQQAELMSAVDGEGIRRDVHLFIGGLRELRGGPAGRPQAFLPHMPPHDEVGAHFHRVDQFQVFFGAKGARYQRTELPVGTVMVHYADAYSTYGPFSSGDGVLEFFTLRAAGDGVTAYMPGARELLIHRGARLTQSILPVGEKEQLVTGETRTDTVLGPDPDGMSCYRLRGGPGSELTGPAPSGSGGQFYCVISGDAQWNGQSFGRKSLAWVGADRDALTVRAGVSGFDVLVMQYPDTPSYPLPDPIISGV